MNKTKGMISGEWHKVKQKAVRWPCAVCDRGVGNNSIQCASFGCFGGLETLCRNWKFFTDVYMWTLISLIHIFRFKKSSKSVQDKWPH